ncbi:MAG: M3 family oligoendopeptidase [Planctomycetota bacterium]
MNTPAPAPRSDFVPADLDAGRWENLQPLYRALVDRELKCAGCLEQLLLDRSDLDAAAREAHVNLYIDMTCHTDSEQAKAAYLDFVEHVEPKLKQVGFDLDRKVVGSPHGGDLEPRRYEVLLRDLRADVEIFREENIPLQTEETKLDQQYEETCGAMTVEFLGEERTLPQMGRFFEETDRSTREAAWRGTWERRHRDHERISEIFDRMIELRGRIAANADFPNFRDYMFKSKHRFDYTPADCAAFHQAVEDVCVPLLRSLDAQRAGALSLDPLRPWDLAVDIKGRTPLRPFERSEDLIERTSGLYHRMDPALGEMFDSLRDGESLDLESRKGKAPGGYQEHRDRSRKPFIFMNAAGLHRDLTTMVHEAGHAFHSILCHDDPLLHYRHAPIEFAEVASMSMELFAFPYLGAFYDDADAARARRKQLESLTVLLPWIATIDAFQHWLYTQPGHSRADRTAFWLELDGRFGPAVSWEGLQQFREMAWQRQGHLFGVPFYYIEYGIAQLGALQLWLHFKEDRAAAVERYKRALGLGGSRPLPELFAAAGLAFDFGPDTMKRLMDEVQQELDALPL